MKTLRLIFLLALALPVSLFAQVPCGSNADFFVLSDFALCPPFPVQFYNTGDTSFNYQWNFGDGYTSTKHEPLHVYLYPGKYKVTLIVSDSTGTCTGTIEKTDFIRVNGPIGSFSLAPDSGAMPLTVTMNGSWTNATQLICDMGDGTTFLDSIPMQYTYTMCGTYFPVVYLSDPLGCAIAYPVDTVRPRKPSGYFSLSPDTGTMPLTVSITGTYFDAVYTNLYMGDGATFLDSIPAEYTYTVCGKYYPQIVLTDSGGCTTSYIIDTVVCTDLLSVEVTNQSAFKLYPNPAGEILVIEFAEETDTRLHVYNMLGQEVLNTALSTKSTFLNIAYLPKGMYRVSVVEYGQIPIGSLFKKQ